MKDLLKEPIKRKILLLVAIFFTTLMVITAVENTVRILSQNYETELDNQRARSNLGKVILKKLLTIELNCNTCVLVNDRRDLDVCKNKIVSSIKDIQSLLNILYHGGNYEDVMPANFGNVNEIKESIFFSRGKEKGYIIEVIDLTPRVLDITHLVDTLFNEVNIKLEASNENMRRHAEDAIALHLKKIFSVLLRSRESANKVFYDTNIKIQHLEKKKKESIYFFALMRYGAFVILSVICIFIFVRTLVQIGEIIEERNKEIVQRRSTEVVLRKSEERLGLALKGADVGMWDWNTKTGKVVFNERWSDMLGYTPNEIEPDIRSWKKLLHPGDMPETMDTLNAHLDGQTAFFEKEYRIRNKSRDWQWILARGKVVERDENGKALRAAGTHIDITKAKEAEAELKQYQENLEQMVEHRTRELEKTQKELVNKASEAEAANCAKSEFIANMSHEIRTPMNGILGFSDLLLEEELTEEQREAVDTIKKSGEILLNLINDILDLSKVESSKMELETIPFNVENLVLDIGDSLKTNLGEKPIEINCHIDDIHTNLLGDPTRLRQIITNLIGNAIKFTDEGEIVISVTSEKEDDKQATLKFSVRDTGIGIPEDKLETIFESFKQADGSTTRKHGGTGLGLNISKKLVQLMGGDIRVESEAGKGSVFSFTAAFKKDPDALEEIQPVALSQLEGKPILIVDDNETALKILADIVKKIGMVPILFRGGEEALACLKEEPSVNGHSSLVEEETNDKLPELAIIDIMMPGLSGHELACKISELTGGKTKMIALSSNAILGCAAEIQKSGFSGFIPKPVRRQVLIDLIRTILGTGEKPPKDIVTRHRVKEIMAHKIRILYAEDNPVNQMLGKKIFERMGFNNVEIAPDGLEAVKRVKENGPYDLIFMDIQMPNMDGVEATKEIRHFETQHTTFETLNPVPIVALTANAMKGDREKYLEAGLDDYVPKPFKREDIQRVIEQWVRQVEMPVEVVREKKILVVEDEEKMRKSIIRIIKRKMPALKVITAEDGIDATAKLGSFKPDLILADIMMPRMDGVEFIDYVRKTERYAKTKIVVITGLRKDDYRVSAVRKAGINEIVYKPWKDKNLVMSIKKALKG